MDVVTRKAIERERAAIVAYLRAQLQPGPRTLTADVIDGIAAGAHVRRRVEPTVQTHKDIKGEPST